jgi:hypothetical protein
MASFGNAHTLNISRRGLLRGAALISGGAALASSLAAIPAAAQTKLSQAAADYRATPRGGARCNTCNQWLAPTDCKVVQGPVSATGWCSLYAPKW